MSEKKMTDEELAKISGAGDKKPVGEHELSVGDEGSGGGGGQGEVDADAPGSEPSDFQRT
jgi:bacteriocin-like protein